jgi:hypothetical protein
MKRLLLIISLVFIEIISNAETINPNSIYLIVRTEYVVNKKTLKVESIIVEVDDGTQTSFKLKKADDTKFLTVAEILNYFDSIGYSVFNYNYFLQYPNFREIVFKKK